MIRVVSLLAGFLPFYNAQVLRLLSTGSRPGGTPGDSVPGTNLWQCASANGNIRSDEIIRWQLLAASGMSICRTTNG